MGMKFLLAISRLLTPAMPADATNTPETGEIVRPIEAASCMGSKK